MAQEVTSETLWNHAINQNVKQAERQEVILLTKVLASPVNTGYHDWTDAVIASVNGVVPRSLAHLAEILDASTNTWLELHTEDGMLAVLDLEEARKANATIWSSYGVSEDRSPDLRPVTGMAGETR